MELSDAEKVFFFLALFSAFSIGFFEFYLQSDLNESGEASNPGVAGQASLGKPVGNPSQTFFLILFSRKEEKASRVRSR